MFLFSCNPDQHQDGREKAISVAIRAHSSLELHEDKYFLLTCASLKTASRGSRQSKALRDREQEGLIFYDLEQGHQQAGSAVAILGRSYYFGPKHEDHLIGSCTAFGARAESTDIVELLDAKACPSDAAIVNSVEFMTDEESKTRRMKVKIKSMFRFPNSDYREPEKSKDSSKASGGRVQVGRQPSHGPVYVRPLCRWQVPCPLYQGSRPAAAVLVCHPVPGHGFRPRPEPGHGV